MSQASDIQELAFPLKKEGIPLSFERCLRPGLGENWGVSSRRECYCSKVRFPDFLLWPWFAHSFTQHVFTPQYLPKVRNTVMQISKIIKLLFWANR